MAKLRCGFFQGISIDVPERDNCIRGQQPLGNGKTKACGAASHNGVSTRYIEPVHIVIPPSMQ
jgi:hypothetical protein